MGYDKMECRAQIREGGRIIIPAIIRKELDIEIGDEIILKVEDGEIRLSTLKHAISQAQHIVKKYNTKGKNLTDELLHLRKEEVDYD